MTKKMWCLINVDTKVPYSSHRGVVYVFPTRESAEYTRKDFKKRGNPYFKVVEAALEIHSK
jgi:hypothetical protein